MDAINKRHPTRYGRHSLQPLTVSRNRAFSKIWDPILGQQVPGYGATLAEQSDGGGIVLSDVIGNFGWFQFLVLLFSGLREACVGYDAVVASIILQPEQHYTCEDGPPILSTPQHGINETAQCFYPNSSQPCDSWLFPKSRYGTSLVVQWQLVCHRSWLVAFIESSYFLGLVTGNLVWGYYADRFGRRKTYIWAHAIAFIFGGASLVMPNVYLFSVCRFLNAFGSIGYNIIYSIQVELIGTKYRAFSTTMNHLGWGIGVIFVPISAHLFTDYRCMLALAPLITFIMFPWALWLPESSRWLMIKGNYAQANRELLRVAKFNGKYVTPNLEKRLSIWGQKVCDERVKQESAKGDQVSQPYRLILSDPKLLRDTLILALISFTGHLFYYMLTINFAYIKNLSVDANFIISGAGEWFSVVVGAVLLKLFSRKTCISLYLILMALGFVLQAILDSNIAPSLNTQLIVTANNAIGTLSGLLLVFVVLIVNQEIYPTVIRQTGSSIVNTLGESGSTLAPILLQVARMIGPWRADLIYAMLCACGCVLAQFITKTDDLELTDT